MFYHVKKLQFNARVSRPDPRFANLLLEQFGGENGELAAAMQYFTQAYCARVPHPDKYDMLMEIATEEFSHLEIVGATIQMLLTGVSGDIKNTADQSEIMSVMDGKAAQENIIHEALNYPQLLALSRSGPKLINSLSIPWCSSYIHSNGDLIVDLRSNLASESRAKIVYEYLMKFTDDPYVKDTLFFLMNREIDHYRIFEAALEDIKPNIDKKVVSYDNEQFSQQIATLFYEQTTYNSWDEAKMAELAKEWNYI